MAHKALSASLVGLDAVTIETEADIINGLPKFNIVGLPDISVKEARDRVKSAIKNSLLPFPDTQLTVNLAPADIRKEGSSFDLPIAVATVAAMQGLPDTDLTRTMFLGELALDGALRPVNGILPAVILALQSRCREIIIPAANAAEAALVAEEAEAAELSIRPAASLAAVVAHLRGESRIAPLTAEARTTMPAIIETDFDLRLVRGQSLARRALEIAAAGGHNLLFSGPPGSGKTMLARCLPSILPPMSPAERLDVTKIYSVAGLTAQGRLIDERPFRSPHHTASGTAVIGGGSWPRPGEVSLAHRGVLFLDEFPEFPRAVLENLRQPLEDGFVTISRAQGTLKFPAKFMLVAARNPCPCGFASDPDTLCRCAPSTVARYQKKISGPLLDRIDLHVEVPKLPNQDLFATGDGESSAQVRNRVAAARAIQAERFSGCGIFTNAEMGRRAVEKQCHLNAETDRVLQAAASKLKLSARAFFRVLKVARTIADLAGRDSLAAADVAEALQYRERG